MMTRQTLTPHPTAECRWSVPAYRLNPMSDDDKAFERYWLCERTSVAVPVTQTDCNRCRHWSPERIPVKAPRRPRR
jgi:hypothetical protein